MNDLEVAIVIEPITNSNLKQLGGTGHWFHLLERVIHIFHIAEIRIWNHGNSNQRDLYIIFNEKDSVNDLNPFGRFLLTSILSGSKYRRVIFGYSPKITIISNNDSGNIIMRTDSFHMAFVVTLDKSYDVNRFVVSDDSNYINNHNNCFQMLLKVPLTRIQNRFGSEWFETISSFHLFRNVSHQVCSIPYTNSINETITWSNNSTLDDISLLSELVLQTRLDKKLKKMSMSTLIPSPIVYNTHKRVLVYQRDRSRLLSLSNTSKCKNESNNNIAECISFLMSSGSHNPTKGTSNQWTTHYMIHSDDRSPCELIQQISTSTVIITPHGFQSILLLFQPLSSLMVEIYPFMYYKPDLFGFIQVGLRQRLLIARSYLCEETLPFNFLQYAIKGVQSIGGFSHRFCINNILCKIFVRNQNTYITEDNIVRVVKFINEHFP